MDKENLNEWEELNEWHKLGWIYKAIKKAQKGDITELNQALDCISFLQSQKRFTSPNKIIYFDD